MFDIKDASFNDLDKSLNFGETEVHKALGSNSKTSSTIVFIDSGVDDYQSLVNGTVPEAEVIVLDSTQDGVEEITKALQRRTDITTIHIVSHGSPGCLYLGNSQLNLDTLNHYGGQLKTWIASTSLTQEGKFTSIPILLYGCNVAAGDAGIEFVEKLHYLTGAEIAASTKPTGSGALGGDWELEITTSNVEVPLAFQAAARAAYGSVLAKGQWIAQGPSPAQNGQVENVQPNNEVAGAIHTVLAHPDDANILYIGAVNGGIWKTTNATDSNPNWTPLTDDLLGNSIGAMEFDPTDPTNQTIIAGIGHFSSFFRLGGPLTGLLKTTDGGDTWTKLGTADNLDNDRDGMVDEADETLLSGRNISGVASRGNMLLVSANNFGGGIGAGVYLSNDNGATWEFISGSNGLDAGAAFDLVGDPTDKQRFYVSVQGNGIFRSDDGGANWINVSDQDANLDRIITGVGNNNTEMAVASNGRLYTAVLTNGQASYIGFTDNPTATNPTWTQMDLPVTQERNGDFEGLNPTENPGGQGAIHFSIIADPNNPNVVYVGGDRQDIPFPNAIGANDFSGRLFRGDTDENPTDPGNPENINSPQWQPLTHSQGSFSGGGTANNSSPHADSREMTFNANGDIIEVDDGGIYRRTNPQDNTGDWFSLNSNLQVTEIHDIAYDTVSNIIISGNQDTGTTQQNNSDSVVWNSVSTADGGDVAVSIDPNNDQQSVRYSSFQFLRSFRRRVYDANNNLISVNRPALNGFFFDTQFVTPVVVNEVDPNRIAIGGFINVYESFDQGDNVSIVNTAGGGFVGVNSRVDDAIAYGGRRNGQDNPDVLYVGSQSSIFARTTSGGILANTNYSGGFVRDIVLDRDDWMTGFAIDDDQVFQTTNANNWIDITGNLQEFATNLNLEPADLNLRSIEFISGSTVDGIVVGSNIGIFSATSSSNFTDWLKLGTDLPNVPVWDLDYDPRDDLLVAGTLGRGAWTLSDASSILLVGITEIGTSNNDNLTGTSRNDTLKGLNSQDTLQGLAGDDLLDGGDGDDNLFGEAGNDTLLGGQGQDKLYGGSGDDLLNGGQGDNILTGGTGKDTFVLSTAGKNTIVDFEDALDLLQLEGGLTFGSLSIFEQNGDTWITTQNNQPLAFLTGVDVNLITAEDFVVV
ncbi:MAG: DUF4347 domain-containing protein [Moorea sp. SIOASIH]|uniref:DUF4347 domain-containing protein n=1 Tax=Moorena sp. SIOASIH TaxID=2607817 RepID=UPI0013BC28F1|nr:DUF4347 domain-containing protein [Moorena sp. SIOASIH]NEO37855.1 DUF4347 domain-containing protein [Moorena sp. SIOASIH]